MKEKQNRKCAGQGRKLQTRHDYYEDLADRLSRHAKLARELGLSVPSVARRSPVSEAGIQQVPKQRALATENSRCDICESGVTAGEQIWSSESAAGERYYVCNKCRDELIYSMRERRTATGPTD